MLVKRFNTEAFDRREKNIWDRIKALENKLAATQSQLKAATILIPGIGNFALNGDGNYSEEGMRAATFTNKAFAAAHWYSIKSGTTTQLTENTVTTESGQSLRDAGHGTYGTPACDWVTASSYFRLGGDGTDGFSLVHPLTKNLFFPGARVFVQMIVKKDTGISITSTHQLQASLFENTAGVRRVIEATATDLVLSAVGGTGSTSRKYAVEIKTTNGISRTNVTTITNSVTTLSSTKYVSISWRQHFGVIQINIYRSEDGGTTYKKITGSGLTGGTSFYDTGADGTTVSLPSASNQKAVAQLVDFGSFLTDNFQLVVFSIPVPPYYVMPTGTGDKQLLEIQIVNSSGTQVSTTAKGIFIDKVGVSYSNGIWQPSPEDLTTAAIVLSTTPPSPPAEPGGGSGGGGTPPVSEPKDGTGTGRPKFIN